MSDVNDFDEFPVYDKLTEKDMHLSGIWISAMSSFIQNLIGYLTANGILLPQLTQAQKLAIPLAKVKNGQMIYNTTNNTAEYFKNGVWTAF